MDQGKAIGGKLVIIRSEEGRMIDMVLKVENHDERFAAVVKDADYAWQNTEEEWYDFMLARIREAGYKVEVVEYETVNT